MTYIKNKDGSFTVSSRSNNTITYTVDKTISNCNCPKFKFILKGKGECHHISEVKLGESKVSRNIERIASGDKYPEFIRAKYLEPLRLYKFIEVYGETQYKDLTDIFEVMLIKGLVRLL